MGLSDPLAAQPADDGGLRVRVDSVARDGARPPLRVYWAGDEATAVGPARPVVLFLHGGGLVSSVAFWPFPGDRFCRDCVRCGKVCVLADYSLSPLPRDLLNGAALAAAGFAALGCWVAAAASLAAALCLAPPSLRRHAVHPGHLAECEEAAAWCVRHAAGFGGDGGRLVVFGESAGGQLALLLALARPGAPRFRGIAILSPPLDYRGSALLRLHWVARLLVRRLLLDGPFGQDSAVLAAASPMELLEHLQPGGRLQGVPLLLLCASSEFWLPWVNAQAALVFRADEAAAALAKGGAEVFREALPGCHFTAIGGLRPLLEPTTRFWRLVDARK